MTKLRYALIGCGRISPNHLAAYLHHTSELELVALCDLDLSAIDRLLETQPQEIPALQGIRRFTDYRELLAEVKPDLVAIATYSGSHASIAKDALQHGAHVLIEKPMALSLKDAREVIELGHAVDRTVAVVHQNRFNRSIQAIRQALEEGHFGRMLHGSATVRWNRNDAYYEQAAWRGTWEHDGGCLMNQCIHNIDLLRWMLGDDMTEIMAITDRQNHEGIEGEDIGLAVARFKNGSYGLIEGTVNIFPRNLEETLDLFGTQGTVKAGGKSVNRIEVWRFGDQEHDPEEMMARFSEDPPNIYGYGHTPLYTDVLEAIRTKRAPLVDGEAGYRAIEVVLAMYRSQKERRPIALPMDDWSTKAMIGCFEKDVNYDEHR